MSHYDSSSRTLPKYRREPSMELRQSNSSYVQGNGSHVPCSPKLVQRKHGQQQRVVTRMLQSYPQSDGSFVCPIRQPAHHPQLATDLNEELPPPLPAKRRELMQMGSQAQSPSVTVSVPYRRNHSANELPVGTTGVDRRSMHARPVSYQQPPISAINEPQYQPAHPLSILRTQSQPNHLGLNVNNHIHSNINGNNKELIKSNITTSPVSTSSTLIISTQNAIPLHSVVSVEHRAQPLHKHNIPRQNTTASVPTRQYNANTGQYNHNTVATTSGYNIRLSSSGQSNPFHFAKPSSVPPSEELLYAQQKRNGAVRRSNSQTSNTSGNSSSTYTGSLEYNSKGYTNTDTQSNIMSESRSSSVEEDSDNNQPELYPEQR